MTIEQQLESALVALEFYADRANYNRIPSLKVEAFISKDTGHAHITDFKDSLPSFVMQDKGRKARRVLQDLNRGLDVGL